MSRKIVSGLPVLLRHSFQISATVRDIRIDSHVKTVYEMLENSITVPFVKKPFSGHSMLEKTVGSDKKTNRGKKIFAFVLLFVIIVCIIVDAIVAPCVLVETNSERILRLRKAGAPLRKDIPNTNKTEINCDSGQKPTFKLVDGSHCESQSACTAVLLTDFVRWTKENLIAGAFAYLAVYAVCTVIFIPGTILTIGAGVAFTAATGSVGWGVLVGSLSVFFWAAIGATLSFILGRYLLFDFAVSLRKRWVVIEAVDMAIQNEGLKTMAMLRLTPFIPFNALNYVMSGTSISLKHYTLGLLGMVPATIVYVYLGASAHQAVSGNYEKDTGSSVLTTVLFVVGALAGLGVVIVVSRKARAYLNDLIEKNKQAVDGDE